MYVYFVFRMCLLLCRRCGYSIVIMPLICRPSIYYVSMAAAEPCSDDGRRWVLRQASGQDYLSEQQEMKFPHALEKVVGSNQHYSLRRIVGHARLYARLLFQIQQIYLGWHNVWFYGTRRTQEREPDPESDMCNAQPDSELSASQWEDSGSDYDIMSSLNMVTTAEYRLAG